MNLQTLGIFLLSALLLNGCRSAPITEICIVGDDGCLCFDPRLAPEHQEYSLTFPQCKNFVARSPDSEARIREWASRNCKGE